MFMFKEASCNIKEALYLEKKDSNQPNQQGSAVVVTGFASD